MRKRVDLAFWGVHAWYGLGSRMPVLELKVSESSYARKLSGLRAGTFGTSGLGFQGLGIVSEKNVMGGLSLISHCSQNTSGLNMPLRFLQHHIRYIYRESRTIKGVIILRVPYMSLNPRPQLLNPTESLDYSGFYTKRP